MNKIFSFKIIGSKTTIEDVKSWKKMYDLIKEGVNDI